VSVALLIVFYLDNMHFIGSGLQHEEVICGLCRIGDALPKHQAGKSAVADLAVLISEAVKVMPESSVLFDREKRRRGEEEKRRGGEEERRRGGEEERRRRARCSYLSVMLTWHIM
jgi:hypothetical protein